MKNAKQVKDEIIRIEVQTATTFQKLKKLKLWQQLSAKGMVLRERILKLEAQKRILFWVLRDEKKNKTNKKS